MTQRKEKTDDREKWERDCLAKAAFCAWSASRPPTNTIAIISPPWRSNGKRLPKLYRASQTPTEIRMPRWRVDIIRKRAEHLGTIEAANEPEAIQKAIKHFEIPPERQNRITVEKMSKSKD